MEQKDYKAIAKIIKSEKTELRLRQENIIIDRISFNLADHFEKDDKREHTITGKIRVKSEMFNPKQFLKACGVEE